MFHSGKYGSRWTHSYFMTKIWTNAWFSVYFFLYFQMKKYAKVLTVSIIKVQRWKSAYCCCFYFHFHFNWRSPRLINELSVALNKANEHHLPTTAQLCSTEKQLLRGADIYGQTGAIWINIVYSSASHSVTWSFLWQFCKSRSTTHSILPFMNLFLVYCSTPPPTISHWLRPDNRQLLVGLFLWPR